MITATRTPSNCKIDCTKIKLGSFLLDPTTRFKIHLSVAQLTGGSVNPATVQTTVVKTALGSKVPGGPGFAPRANDERRLYKTNCLVQVGPATTTPPDANGNTLIKFEAVIPAEISTGKKFNIFQKFGRREFIIKPQPIQVSGDDGISICLSAEPSSTNIHLSIQIQFNVNSMEVSIFMPPSNLCSQGTSNS